MLKHRRLQAESKLLNKNVIKLSAWKEITEIIHFIPEEPSYVSWSNLTGQLFDKFKLM